MEKNNLLKISEFARLTDVSIYSLRYYERIKILEPAYIDPQTGYRFYASQQVFHIMLIQFCVELDIPLKELARFTDSKGIIDSPSLLAHGKKLATQKLGKIQLGLAFIESIEERSRKIQTADSQQHSYTQEFPEKYLHVIPYELPFGGIHQFEEVARAFLKFEYGGDDDYGAFSEFGLLKICTKTQSKRYLFAELAQPKEGIQMVVLPKGDWHCRQNTDIAIEHTQELFAGYLKEGKSYIAVETAFFAGGFEIGHPVSELRVIKN
ncbi:MAG: MerR family DNA-binding transcriptional regulator [Turicibacter sp.]|nr:MerR family DNA-binding transcriptional regulator [Turicibacter sp.]